MRYEQCYDGVNWVFTLRVLNIRLSFAEHWMYSNSARVGHLIEFLSVDSLKYTMQLLSFTIK